MSSDSERKAGLSSVLVLFGTIIALVAMIVTVAYVALLRFGFGLSWGISLVAYLMTVMSLVSMFVYWIKIGNGSDMPNIPQRTFTAPEAWPWERHTSELSLAGARELRRH